MKSPKTRVEVGGDYRELLRRISEYEYAVNRIDMTPSQVAQKCILLAWEECYATGRMADEDRKHPPVDWAQNFERTQDIRWWVLNSDEPMEQETPAEIVSLRAWL